MRDGSEEADRRTHCASLLSCLERIIVDDYTRFIGCRIFERTSRAVGGRSSLKCIRITENTLSCDVYALHKVSSLGKMYVTVLKPHRFHETRYFI